MKRLLNIQDLVFRSGRSVVLVIALTLGVLGMALVAAELAFREHMRSQILEQDAAILQGIGLMQHEAGQSSGEFFGPTENPESYFDELLAISRYQGVIGVRLFDANGDFINAFPYNITETGIPSEALARLKGNKPVSQFIPRAPLAEIDLLASEAESKSTAPILVISIPLPSRSGFIGAAQFIIQGASIADAWDKLDHDLMFVGWTIFMSCGALLAIILMIAFHRLRSMNRMLFDANQDLAMAARVNAVGAVAAHLIHGLKNPLSGLHSFVTETGGAGNPDWQAAISSTQRMQSLINQTVGILQEQQSGVDYEVTAAQLVQLLDRSVGEQARAVRIEFRKEISADATFSSRDANLLVLILENLIQNALQATPSGKSVQLTFSRVERRLQFEVRDEGPGFPQELIDSLFKPCRSKKVGGGGIGLAICKQLALQMGASIHLASSTAQGCVFRLSYPVEKAPALKKPPESIST